MLGLNRVQIMGNLGRDPEMRYTPTGRAMTRFSVAVNRRWRNKDGQTQEEVEWFRVVAWGRVAEVSNQYLEKGSPVYVEGRLQTRSFEGDDGRTRYITELVAQQVIFLPRGNGRTPEEDPFAAELEEEELAEMPL